MAGPSTWRVGVLFSQTGVTAGIESTQLDGTMLAIEEINDAGGVRGKPLEPLIYDGRSDPKVFRANAERLLGHDRVRVIFGCYMSSTRKAVLPTVESFRGLLFYPTLYEGFEYSPHCIYTGAAPNQNMVQLAKYLFEFVGTRIYMVGSNYVYPYETNRIMSDFVVQSRGRVLGESYLPLEPRAGDLDKVIRDIAKAKPEVLFSTVVGSGTARLYEAIRAAGISPRELPIASLTTSEAEVAEMAPGAAENSITAAPFFESLGLPAAKKFVAAYRARFGEDRPVTAGAEAAYFQVHLFARALERAGSDNFPDLLPEVRKVEFAAPQGPVRIDPENNHALLWPRVARVNSKGRFDVVWNPGVRLKPDPYFVAPSLDDWSAEMAQATHS
ncbi:MAG: transporter substrate-binding domain-containing protein [Minwuia sp.]|uniref:transporter substrate-binding domain-containing protein n=1 Tax=Minwuia sp. TaxID=2493630 RepID=UPI003A8BB240